MKHVSLGIIIHRVTAKRLCFRSFELTDRFIRHSSSGKGGVAVNFQYQPRDFFSTRPSYSNVFPPSTSFGNWEERSKGEKERQVGHMGEFICTLMHNVTYGIDVTREWKRSTGLKQGSQCQTHLRFYISLRVSLSSRFNYHAWHCIESWGLKSKHRHVSKWKKKKKKPWNKRRDKR